MATFDKLCIPSGGERIEVKAGEIVVPNQPIIPFIEGDGIGPDITRASKMVWDAAVELAYSGSRQIAWLEIHAGEKAQDIHGSVLPDDTLKAIDHFVVAIKGPLPTPVGGGFRSLNVTLRQELDLFACVRPVKWIEGVPSPVRSPEQMDTVIFRENTEDVYAGIEWSAGSAEAAKVIEFMKREMKVDIREDSGIGVKPISRFATRRLVDKAIRYAIDRNRSSVTFVHKGNIMKFTEGAFRDWGYEFAEEEFGANTMTEDYLYSSHGGQVPEGKIVINDRIADSMFQQVLMRPGEYDVLAMPNLNGDYLSDACAAQVGGLGMAPGGNLGDHVALFEATHGTAPKYAGQDRINPSSLILSGVMMLEYLGWQEAGDLIGDGISETIKQRRVTYDLSRQLGDVEPIKCSEFGAAIVENMNASCV